MPRISLWNRGAKSHDYRFIDRNITEFFNASGTGVLAHLYEGTYGQDGKPDQDVTQLQDVVFQENRDRKYSKNVIEMRGTYNVQDSDFDLRQFGLFLTGDTLFIEFAMNEMVRLCGRKLIAGDVLELPHLRDDLLLDEGKAINKFYVVEDANRSTGGYGPDWLPHVWRVKMSPMTASQEYADILDTANTDPFGLLTGDTLGDLMGSISSNMDLNQQIVDLAIADVKARNFETRQYWFVEADQTTTDRPWIFAGDGVPPNGALLVGSGDTYPEDMPEGAYFLRTDYAPHALFRKTGPAWIMQELDWRGSQWSAAHRLLEDFLNNTDTTVLDDGTTMATKQALSKMVRPKADF